MCEDGFAYTVEGNEDRHVLAWYRCRPTGRTEKAIVDREHRHRLHLLFRMGKVRLCLCTPPYTGSTPRPERDMRDLMVLNHLFSWLRRCRHSRRAGRLLSFWRWILRSLPSCLWQIPRGRSRQTAGSW